MKRTAISALVLLALAAVAGSAAAYPSYFTNRCASCHSDDTPTCNGCHQHRGNVQASLDAASYAPGDLVSATLTGGQKTGWVRGILYDHNDVVVALASGPSGTGDDGGANDVVFPITLQASAPTAAGDYAWQAAWFGAVTAGGGVHEELRRTVTVHVEGLNTAVDGSSWSAIKRLY